MIAIDSIVSYPTLTIAPVLIPSCNPSPLNSAPRQLLRPATSLRQIDIFSKDGWKKRKAAVGLSQSSTTLRLKGRWSGRAELRCFLIIEASIFFALNLRSGKSPFCPVRPCLPRAPHVRNQHLGIDPSTAQ